MVGADGRWGDTEIAPPSRSAILSQLWRSVFEVGRPPGPRGRLRGGARPAPGAEGRRKRSVRARPEWRSLWGGLMIVARTLGRDGARNADGCSC